MKGVLSPITDEHTEPPAQSCWSRSHKSEWAHGHGVRDEGREGWAAGPGECRVGHRAQGALVRASCSDEPGRLAQWASPCPVSPLPGEVAQDPHLGHPGASPMVPPDLEELQLLGSAPEEGVGQHVGGRGARLRQRAQHGLDQAPGHHLVWGEEGGFRPARPRARLPPCLPGYVPSPWASSSRWARQGAPARMLAWRYRLSPKGWPPPEST